MSPELFAAAKWAEKLIYEGRSKSYAVKCAAKWKKIPISHVNNAVSEIIPPEFFHARRNRNYKSIKPKDNKVSLHIESHLRQKHFESI